MCKANHQAYISYMYFNHERKLCINHLPPRILFAFYTLCFVSKYLNLRFYKQSDFKPKFSEEGIVVNILPFVK